MGKKEIFYSDLSLIAAEKPDEQPSKTNWLAAPYETPDYKGVALFAGETCFPKPVTLKLNAEGWHKIYLCIAEVTGSNNIEVSLSKEGGKTMIMPSHLGMTDGTFAWSRFDFAEEVFYKAADLTGQDLIINKPVYGVISSASLFYVRLVPMTEAEVKEYGNPENTERMAYHFDNDYMVECDYEKPEDYLGRIEMLHAGNADMIVHECHKLERCDNTSISYFRTVSAEKTDKIASLFDKVNFAIVERAHSYGMKAYAGCRIEAGNFIFPHTNLIDQSESYGGNDMRIRTREGRYIAAGSFAYEKVRKITIENILKWLPEKWDGVSVFLHRGIFVGFENPIKKYVYEKYGVEADRLPYGDERLTEALSVPMTEFFRELRTALNARAEAEHRVRYGINVVSLFSKENSKEMGYDFDKWAEKGLIDSVCQGLMGYKENVEDMIDADGFIDLDKYRVAQKTRHVFTRYYDADKKVITDALPSWLKFSKKYGVKFYATMPWEWPDYNGQIDMAKALYKAGAENLFAWNTNHSAKRPATIQAIKDCGNKEKILAKNNTEYRKLVRIYSLCGNDVSTFCVNWKG